MKRVLLIIIFIAPALISAQDLSVFVPDIFNSYEEATINFNDGTTIRGYAKVTYNSSIKFKVNEDSKPDVWTELMLEGVTFHGALNDVNFMYVKLKKVKTPLLLEVIELGEISLFVDVSSEWSQPNNFNDNNELLNNVSKTRNVSYSFFLKKEEEKEAIRLFGIFNFRKKAIQYFENCVQIVDKLKEKKYNRGDIVEMVYYYNDYCAALD